MTKTRALTLAAAALAVVALGPIQAQEQVDSAVPVTIEVKPGEVELEVGEILQLEATVRDAGGNVLEEATVLYFSLARRNVGVTPAGLLEAYRPGEFAILARVPKDPDGDPRRGEALVQQRITVTIPFPPVASLEINDRPDRDYYYARTLVRPTTVVTDETGTRRTDVPVEYTSSDPSVVDVTKHGHLMIGHPGSAIVTAVAESIETAFTVNVVANPTVSLSLEASVTEARTGGVVFFDARARDAAGNVIEGMPIQFAFHQRTVDYQLGEPSAGMVRDDGAFVAELPGEFTIVAVAGNISESRTIKVVPRNAKREIEVLGQGQVNDRKTSDLWVWEAPDGRDYAVTGTWGAAGHAYFWDVTDPTSIQLIDIVRVDARTVNDVKVSEDGSIAIISREGASDRKNGLVIIDVSSPLEGVRVLARYDDQLTGGVHNVFIYEDHVYALSAGRRYDIINIEDPTQPYRVGRFELDTPGHSIHDVWVSDGIAVSSNWTDGVVAVDVGGGGNGGSPRNPVKLGSYTYPSGWNHAAFPYRSKSTGKYYIFAGDEAFPSERNPLGLDRFVGPPVIAAGWIHVIEFDDWSEPREVARYQVPYAGTHNFWVEDDILYIGYYNGGLRVVDVSGELMGDLYRQGREIAYFLSYDPEGFKPNAPRIWGAMTHKGNIFFADNNSGLWAVRFKPDETLASGASQ